MVKNQRELHFEILALKRANTTLLETIDTLNAVITDLKTKGI